MSGQVEFIGLYRANEKALLLASVFSHGPTSTLDKSHIEKHFVDIAAEEAHKLSGYTSTATVNSYHCYVMYDEELSCFFCAAAPLAFSDRLSWDALRAAKEEVAKLPREDLEKARALGLNKTLRTPFRELMSGHKTDKLASAQEVVETVKSQMTLNMKQMTENLQNVDDLEARAADMEGHAHQYQNHALALKRHAQVEYWKWVLMFGSIVIVSFMIILWATGVFESRTTE